MTEEFVLEDNVMVGRVQSELPRNTLRRSTPEDEAPVIPGGSIDVRYFCR
jgi:hypothetical protein